MKNTHLLLGTALVLGGCGAAHGTREPSAYEQERLDRLALIEEASQPTLISLVHSAQTPFFDGSGNTISTGTFLELLDTVHTRYREYYESDRIRISTDGDSDDELGATLHEATNDENSIIAFSTWLEPVDWTAGQISHEIGHEISTLDASLPEHGHSSAVDNAIDGSIASFAETAWENKDLPYAISLLREPIDSAMRKAEAEAIYYKDFSLDKVRSGEWTSKQAEEYFESWHAAALAEPWSVTAAAELNGDFKIYMGWDDSELIDAFNAGNLSVISEQDWERIGGELDEALAELDEAKRELREGNYDSPGHERSEPLSHR